MIIDRDNLRDVLIALAVVGLVSLLWTAAAHAQFGSPTVITAPGSVTQDATTEQNTAPIPQILQEDTTSASSLSTAGGAGYFQPQSPFLNSLMQTLGSGIPNAATYAAYFQGWVDFGANAATLAASIAGAIVQSDENTLTVYQSQAGDFAAEDQVASNVETCNQTAGATQSVLYALQCNTEAQLLVYQQLQLQRQLTITRGINEVVHGAYDFNADAQSGAHMQNWFTQASQD
jgi:hypothetical protein